MQDENPVSGGKGLKDTKDELPSASGAGSEPAVKTPTKTIFP